MSTEANGMEVLFSWVILYYTPVKEFRGTGPVPLELYAAAWLGIALIFGLD